MPSSETVRAIIFVSLAILGCLIRTYIRTANGEKEDEVHFWSSPFSQLQQQEGAQSGEDVAPLMHQVEPHYSRSAHRPRSTNTSSGEVSQAVSVQHDQPPRFAPFLAETVPEADEDEFLTYAPETRQTRLIQICDGPEVDEAYEDWAAMHHALGAAPEDAETSIDNLLQRRQMQKSGMHSLGHFDNLGSSEASTPTIWTAHFPAAQLRPY
ncbi:hypothetical protein PSEUBRA_000198 [Kalmanozyma brasiliensis GHG001]|uniref:uncharacterized protein n=1 Tax=Kalmanozyma brasiliensis (strain GHG001) TaxID=1365824 RepID=UPI002867D7EA|nr:uncharacterized protein PSEUBRA_000198 [Kalmanozyma brasiliensis GHG001]KAF6766787.1 hypothetical protein PSEUBRA_000198 [Kalmanozyma brasiliensis GHG001]